MINDDIRYLIGKNKTKTYTIHSDKISVDVLEDADQETGAGEDLNPSSINRCTRNRACKLLLVNQERPHGLIIATRRNLGRGNFVRQRDMVPWLSLEVSNLEFSTQKPRCNPVVRGGSTGQAQLQCTYFYVNPKHVFHWNS